MTHQNVNTVNLPPGSQQLPQFASPAITAYGTNTIQHPQQQQQQQQQPPNPHGMTHPAYLHSTQHGQMTGAPQPTTAMQQFAHQQQQPHTQHQQQQPYASQQQQPYINSGGTMLPPQHPFRKG